MNIDFFTLFGVAPQFTQEASVLKARYLELQQKMHPDNFVNALANERQLANQYAAIVNEAYQVLKCPLQRAIYILKINGVDTQSETDTHMPADFLLEQMEFHERIAELSDDKERAFLEKQLNENWQGCEKGLADTLDSTPKALNEARIWVRKMQFYAKLRQEAAVCLS